MLMILLASASANSPAECFKYSYFEHYRVDKASLPPGIQSRGPATELRFENSRSVPLIFKFERADTKVRVYLFKGLAKLAYGSSLEDASVGRYGHLDILLDLQNPERPVYRDNDPIPLPKERAFRLPCEQGRRTFSISGVVSYDLKVKDCTGHGT